MLILEAAGDILQFSIDDSEHVCLQLHQRGEYECRGPGGEVRGGKGYVHGALIKIHCVLINVENYTNWTQKSGK